MGRPPMRVGSSEAPTTAIERGRTSGSSEANEADPTDGLLPPARDMTSSSLLLGTTRWARATVDRRYPFPSVSHGPGQPYHLAPHRPLARRACRELLGRAGHQASTRRQEPLLQVLVGREPPLRVGQPVDD